MAVSLPVAGCAARAVRQDWQPEQGYEALLSLAAAPLEQVQDLTAEARVAVWQDGRGGRGAAVVQYLRPDLFRVEVRGPLHSHVFTALIEGDSLTVWGPAVGGGWRGPADGPLLAHLTGLVLPGSGLPGLLLGTVAPGAVDSAGAVAAGERGQVVVPLAGAGPRRQVWIDVRRGLVTRELTAGAHGEAVDRLLSRYRRVGPLVLPGKVELRQGAATVVLEYRRIELNNGLSATRLRQGRPREGLQQYP